MYIGRIMHKDVITITPDASLVKAKELTEKNNIDHLLVVDDEGRLKGVLSDRDLKKYWASPANTLSTHELSYLIEKIEVGMVMTKTVVTIPPDTTIERAAHIMQTHNINSLPVMEQDELVGIITSTDVMGVLLEAIGMHEDSVRICVLVTDRIGTLSEVTEILKDNQINIQSLVTWPVKQYPGTHQLVMRLPGDDGTKAVTALTKKGFKVLTRYVKDLSQYLPDAV
ncbi:MAG: CBS domain-containing protein [Desulfobulbaceae bacterium]|nr:MAG: CBS domain-containing protein [Desulfobulbaceae bacterium]